MLLKKKLDFFKKIVLFIFIFIIPFSINNFYSSYLDFKNSSLDFKDSSLDFKNSSIHDHIHPNIQDHTHPQKKNHNQRQFFANKKYDDFFFIAFNNRILKLHSSKYASDYCPTIYGNIKTEKLDQITSGRICGWEILIRDISLKNL